MNDTLTGNYEDGGAALEVPLGGLPILDASNNTSPFVLPAAEAKVTPANGTVTDASKNREWYSGDSPAGEASPTSTSAATDS